MFSVHRHLCDNAYLTLPCFFLVSYRSVWCAGIISRTCFAETGIDTWLQFCTTPTVMTSTVMSPLLTSLKNASCFAGFFVFFHTYLLNQLDGLSVYRPVSPLGFGLCFPYFFFALRLLEWTWHWPLRGSNKSKPTAVWRIEPLHPFCTNTFFCLTWRSIRWKMELFVFVLYFIFLFFSPFTPSQKVSKPLIG